MTIPPSSEVQPTPSALLPSFEPLNDKSSLFPILENVLRSDLVELYGCQEETISRIGKEIDHRSEVILLNDTAAGFLVWKIAKQRDSFIISNLHVIIDQPSTAQEIGSSLIERAIQLGRENQANQLNITLHDRDLNLIHALKCKGFRKLETSRIKSSDVFKYFFSCRLDDQTQEGSCDLTQDEELNSDPHAETASKREPPFSKRPRIALGKPPLYPRSSTVDPLKRAKVPSPSLPISHESPPRRVLQTISLSSRRVRRNDHSLTLHPKCVEQIRRGEKTIKEVSNTGIFQTFAVGDTIRFSDDTNKENEVICTITKISKYPTLMQMLQIEGIHRCIPEACTLENALNIYSNSLNYSRSTSGDGILALHLKPYSSK